jgi:hypothetical protein
VPVDGTDNNDCGEAKTKQIRDDIRYENQDKCVSERLPGVD